jgi:hypothetical protein
VFYPLELMKQRSQMEESDRRSQEVSSYFFPSAISISIGFILIQKMMPNLLEVSSAGFRSCYAISDEYSMDKSILSLSQEPVVLFPYF